MYVGVCVRVRTCVRKGLEIGNWGGSSGTLARDNPAHPDTSVRHKHDIKFCPHATAFVVTTNAHH